MGVPRREIVREVFLLWLITLVLIRAIVEIVGRVGVPDLARQLFLAVVPILFIYAPVALCWLRGVDSYDYPLYLPRLSDRAAWVEAIKLNAVAIGVVAVPLVVGYQWWQKIAFGLVNQWIWPSAPLTLIGYHLFFVAIPEEFFYRGYVQSRLDEAFRPRWRILGADLGPGWVFTCLVFAFGHSLVQFQWWHFAIFFPSLIFGWMRARTGGILAGALFHAWSNVTVTTLDTLFGIVPP